MPNEEHLRILLQGVEAWNNYRQENPAIEPNLSGADLRRGNLFRANLSGVSLRRANLFRANLREANLSRGNLSRVNLSMANLTEANLSGASLQGAILVETNLEGTILMGYRIYGISAWNVNINKKTRQLDLVITKSDEPDIKVDDLEVAQFIYLLLNNEKLRKVIDTVTSKVVLILGRFTDDRKKVLDAMKDELRSRNYTPVLFDFYKPSSLDLTETISLLARMARFIIADITDPKSIPQELGTIVPDLPSVPVQPLLLKGTSEYGMFEHFKRYPWVLAIHRYRDLDDLLSTIKENVIEPAEAKVKEIREG